MNAETPINPLLSGMMVPKCQISKSVLVCWVGVFAFSNDLRRRSSHGYIQLQIRFLLFYRYWRRAMVKDFLQTTCRQRAPTTTA